MSARVVWRERPSRHYRRYTNPARYPYHVHWGNTRLTIPAIVRTYVGARLIAELWHLVGRRHIWIERRRGDE